MNSEDAEFGGMHRYYGSAIGAAARCDEHEVTVEWDRGLAFEVDGVRILREPLAVPTDVLDHPDWKSNIADGAESKLKEIYENDQR